MGIKVSYFKDGNELESYNKAPCFSALREINDEVSEIHYYLQTKATIELKKWWFNLLKEWGFEFEVRKNNLLVVKLETFLDRTIILMLLRYLDTSEDMLNIVSSVQKWSSEFPEYDKFHLFQVSHYINFYQFYFNTNHTIFNNSTQKLISLEEFQSNISNLRGKKWAYGVILETTNPIWVRSQETQNATREGNVPELIKLLS